MINNNKSILLGILMLLSVQSQSQVSISGLPCVVAGGSIGYLYSISGDFKNADNITWKIIGGVVAGSTNSSLTGTISSSGNQVRIIWNKGISAGKLMLTNGRLGNAELNVSILSFDNIISTSAGIIKIGSAVTINGSGPSSNSCIPLSNYWWENAADTQGPFNTIDNATGKNVTINLVTQKLYYRRALSINGDIVYSNLLLIDPQ